MVVELKEAVLEFLPLSIGHIDGLMGSNFSFSIYYEIFSFVSGCFMQAD
jgi:hypothetical protein